MATDIAFGKRAKVSWRFKRADGSDGKVDGTPTFNVPAEEVKQNDDGSWSAVFSGTGAVSVSTSADVDLGPDAKVVDFPLAELNFLAEGQTETVSDITVEPV
jgi:hypothetical protein